MGLYHLGQPERAKAIFRQLNMVIRDTAALAAIEMINTTGREIEPQ
jgi:hypothetical protein